MAQKPKTLCGQCVLSPPISSVGTLVGVFCQVKTGGDLVRDRALKFLHMKLKTGSKELLNKEGEIHLFEEIKACTFEVIRLHA